MENNNYGPVETEEIQKLLKEKKQVEQEHMRSILMHQMHGRSQKKYKDKAEELELERKAIEQSQQIASLAQTEEIEKVKAEKEKFKEAWREQTKQKNGEKIVGRDM